MQRNLTGCGHTLPKLILTIALGLSTTLATQKASAVDVFTDPVGFVTLTVLGTANPPAVNPYVSLASLGMTQLPVSRGNATAVSANKVGVNSTLTTGQFNPTSDGNPTHFIELTSGANAGQMDDIVSNDTANVFTFSDLTSDIGAGTTYKIYPHWTLGKVFGPNNEAGFGTGASPAAADNIQVWTQATQSYGVTYYFKVGGIPVGSGWRSNASTTVNTSNAVLYVDNGLLFLRRSASDVTNKVVGGVKLGSTISVVYTNSSTIIGNVYPAGTTLGGSGLFTGSDATGLHPGASPAAADNIQVWDNASQSYAITYYFKVGGIPVGSGWRSNASTTVDASGSTIPLGASILVVRRVPGPTFEWHAPQPFTQ